MNMQYNSYEINKAYRKEQEVRSENTRLVDAVQDEKAPIWFSPVMISAFILVISGTVLLSFFVWSFAA